jgi:uncharacterized protein YbcV (DUF1398 family)
MDTPIIMVKRITRFSTVAKYNPLSVSDKSNINDFKNDLKAHQQGKTDYLTFCADCAKSGIKKWALCFIKMTCTYFDKAGYEVLVEKVPAS